MTIGSEPDIESRLASHVFVRIAQLQDANIPLFPALHHLRILKPCSSFDCLHLLLSSALTTLELQGTAIDGPDPHYSSLLSFFECVVDEAPDLSTLILGPGEIKSQIIQKSMAYNNLRRFELLGVCAITDRLLRDMGSLQCLEELVLRDKENLDIEQHTISTRSIFAAPLGMETSYDSSLFSFDFGATSSAPSAFQPQPTHEVSSVSWVCSTESKLSVRHPLFRALRSLEVVGVSSLNLIQDLLEEVSSSVLKELSLDLTKILVEESLETINSLTCFENAEFRVETALTSLLKRSVEKWNHTLVSINITNEHTTTIFIPFEILLLLPNIQYLRITGFDLDYMLGSLSRLTNSKLVVLHLPVHSYVSGIPLKELQSIAMACPQLESLRCRFEDLCNVKIPDPLSHPLKELSVSDDIGVLQPEASLKIGHYLDAIFPNIESIATQDCGKGNNGGAEAWHFIFGVVRLCQDVRKEDEKRRLKQKVIECSSAINVAT